MLPPKQHSNKIADSDFDDILNSKSKAGGKSSQKVDDDMFNSLLESKPKTKGLMESRKPGNPLSKVDTSPEQVEAHWKIQDEYEETKEDIQDEFSDEEDDVHDAFNFTDTEFDWNNRDDYDMETEVLKNNAQSLECIPEEDDDGEKTIQRKKWEFEIRQHEKRIRDYEKGQKQKWNHMVQYCNDDEKVAQSWYEFAAKKVDQLDDDKMEEISSEIQSYVYAHGIDQHENMAFELFCYIIKESDIQAIKEDLEAVKERVELI